MQTAKAIQRRIEILLNEAFEAGEQAKLITIHDANTMSRAMALQKIEFAAALAAKHLQWVLDAPVVYSSQQE